MAPKNFSIEAGAGGIEHGQNELARLAGDGGFG